jgi:predicted HTH domain antitoxin
MLSNLNILNIPQDILDSARLTIDDLRTEIAVSLYAQRRLSIGKAHELADMSLWEFRQLLAFRRISPDYDVSDLDEDMATLQELRRL